MSDEIFFREVNEEIRQERARAIWTRYGKLLIAGAVLAVVLAAGYVLWSQYQERQASASGDRYLAAVELASAGNLDQALTELEGLSESGYGAYRDLARMRVAAVREAQGDPAAAVTAFDAISADAAAPDSIRDMAAVRAAYVLVDSGGIDDVRQRVERLSGDAEPLRFAAREVLGLAEWKAGNLVEAKRFFDQLSADQGTPGGIALRTRVMLDLIASGTSPVSAAAATTMAPATPATPEATAPTIEAPAAATPDPVSPVLPTTPQPDAAASGTAAPAPPMTPAPETAAPETAAPNAAPSPSEPAIAPAAPVNSTPAPATTAPSPAGEAPSSAPAPGEAPVPAPSAPVEAPAAEPTSPAPAPGTAPAN